MSQILGDVGPLYEGQWFSYTDAEGNHWCQVDTLLETWDRVLIVEAKLSLLRVTTAVKQLDKLYRPVVEKCFKKPSMKVVAFKYWVKNPEIRLEMVDNPREILNAPLKHEKTVFGWHMM